MISHDDSVQDEYGEYGEYGECGECGEYDSVLQDYGSQSGKTRYHTTLVRCDSCLIIIIAVSALQT